MWLEFVVVTVLAPRGFSPGTPVFPSTQKFQFDSATSLSVAVPTPPPPPPYEEKTGGGREC